MREEAKVGQRTTLDVLNAQQALLQRARAAGHRAARSGRRSYTLLSAIGRLSVQVLGLNTPVYDPSDHYEQTKNHFIGLTASDGR